MAIKSFLKCKVYLLNNQHYNLRVFSKEQGAKAFRKFHSYKAIVFPVFA